MRDLVEDDRGHQHAEVDDLDPADPVGADEDGDDDHDHRGDDRVALTGGSGFLGGCDPPLPPKPIDAPGPLRCGWRG